MYVIWLTNIFGKSIPKFTWANRLEENVWCIFAVQGCQLPMMSETVSSNKVGQGFKLDMCLTQAACKCPMNVFTKRSCTRSSS